MAATATSFLEVDGAGLATARQASINVATDAVAPSVSLETTVNTYSWVGAFLAPPAAGAFLTITPPTGDKKLHIKSVRVSGNAGTPAGMNVRLFRASTAGVPAGGTTQTAITAAKRVTGDANPTTVVKAIGGSAFGTPPVLVAVIALGAIYVNDVDTIGNSGEFYREFGTTGEEAIVVAGAGDYIAVDIAGGSYPSGVLMWEVVAQEV